MPDRGGTAAKGGAESASTAISLPQYEKALQATPGSGLERSIFLGDINGLIGLLDAAKCAFLLASVARFLYPVVGLGCGWSGMVILRAEAGFFEQIRPEQGKLQRE
jgi:hypothetical protein